jgi:hypothetical protein
MQSTGLTIWGLQRSRYLSVASYRDGAAEPQEALQRDATIIRIQLYCNSEYLMYRKIGVNRQPIKFQPELEKRLNMIARAESGGHISAASKERISYVKQMLGELSQVARAEQAELLVYLLEMAFTEAGDILTGKSAPASQHVKRNQTGRMSM